MQSWVEGHVLVLSDEGVLKFNEIVDRCEDCGAVDKKASAVVLAFCFGLQVKVAADDESDAVEGVPVDVKRSCFDGLPKVKGRLRSYSNFGLCWGEDLSFYDLIEHLIEERDVDIALTLSLLLRKRVDFILQSLSVDHFY
jgi:hypothetical protein